MQSRHRPSNFVEADSVILATLAATFSGQRGHFLSLVMRLANPKSHAPSFLHNIVTLKRWTADVKGHRPCLERPLISELMEMQSQCEKRTSSEPRIKSPVVRFSAMGLMICSTRICISLLTSCSARNMVSLIVLSSRYFSRLGVCLETYQVHLLEDGSRCPLVCHTFLMQSELYCRWGGLAS